MALFNLPSLKATEMVEQPTDELQFSEAGINQSPSFFKDLVRKGDTGVLAPAEILQQA